MDLQLTPAEIRRYNKSRPRSARGSICHAPSKSLYFGMRGEVMLCCANRSHLAGRYPQQSIREIWGSAQTIKVIEALAKGDMSQGCKGCCELIKGGNYANMPGRIYDEIPASPGGWPSRMDFELSNTCNLECVMCRGELSSAIRRNRDKLPPIQSPYDNAFLEQLEEFIPHLQQSYFAGGEPFMIQQYLEIWDRMAVLNPDHQLSVQTNATLISDRVKRLLEQLRISIAISIDAVTPERLEAIRVNAKWDTVLANIHYLRDYCIRKGTLLTVSYTPMTLNWMELPEAIQFCNDLDIKIYFNNLSYPRPLAFANMAAQELEEVVRHLKSYKPPKRGEVQQANRNSYLNLLSQIDYWRQEAWKRERTVPRNAKPRGEDYFQAFQTFLQEKYNPEEATSLYEEIAPKLREVFAIAAEEERTEQVWQLVGETDFAMLCTYIPGKTVAELVAAWRTAG